MSYIIICVGLLLITILVYFLGKSFDNIINKKIGEFNERREEEKEKKSESFVSQIKNKVNKNRNNGKG